MIAIILAGGKGSRLGDLSKVLPKPMTEISGKPLLQHQIELCRKYGVTEIIITVGYLHEIIIEYFGDGSEFGVDIDYYIETAPLGSSGAVAMLSEKLKEDFLVINGDAMLDMDLTRLITYHKEHGGDVTLVAHPNDHPLDSELIEVDGHGQVKQFHLRPHREDQWFRNLVNAGVHIFSPRILAYIPTNTKSDWGKDVFKNALEDLNFYAYETPEFIKDMGTPGRLEKVRADHKSGKIQLLNLENTRPAFFLDRDGVINKENGWISSEDQFHLLPQVIDAIKKINQSGYLAIVITNQPVIARGECSIEELEGIHRKMETLLGREGAKLDAIYYCPHHPDKGFEGENVEYKIKCNCRKPAIGLIEDAVSRFNIDVPRSCFIGDSIIDMLAGKNAGLKTIGVGNILQKPDTEKDVADFYASDLPEAVDVLLNNSNESTKIKFL